MSFKREKIKNYYLYDTHVENVFISEYMANAPGDYVKVYLFASMYAGIRVTLSHEDIARQLSLSVEDVLKAWSYWEAKGVIRKHYAGEEDKLRYKVEFLNLKEQLYGKGSKDAGKNTARQSGGGLDEEEIRILYNRIEQITGRPFTAKEPLTIASWLSDYEFSPEVILYAYEYCTKRRGNNKASYVGAVVHQWASSGLRTLEQIKEHVQETDNRHYLYKRIFKALGFVRLPGEAEQKIMDSWFDELGFDLDKILEACGKSSGIPNPSINYVNGILKNWKEGDRKSVPGAESSASGGNIIQQAMDSYEADRREEEEAAGKRREEVFAAIPRIQEIEEELRSLGLEISKKMLGGGESAKRDIRMIRDKMQKLGGEKAYLLTDHNYPADYMDIRYKCSNCKDTGLLDSGERCACFEAKLQEFGKRFEKKA